MPDTYRVKSIAPSTPLDWTGAPALEEFMYPWHQHKPARMTFRAVWDNQHLHVRFEVRDDYEVPPHTIASKYDILEHDRVEIFFRINESMSPYYGLEIDSLGRVMDYQAHHYRKFNYEWRWPGLKTCGQPLENGYAVEIAIPLASLENLQLLHADGTLQAGLFRGKRVHRAGAYDFDWISWIDPLTAEPDFHVPASFGKLILQRPSK